MRLLPLLLLPASLAFAQLPKKSNDMGIEMGHYHLNVKDVEESKKFWMQIGATPVKIGNTEILKYPDGLIFMRKADPSGGTDGSTVNHIGFKVPDLPAWLEKVRSQGIKVVRELPATHQAFVQSPDGVLIEFTEDKSVTVPITNHHIHFRAANVEETRGWYVKTFGGVPGKRGANETATLPGVELAFAAVPANAGPLVGTKGRALDHIGFEVKDLEPFCKKLEASGVKFDVAYRKVPALGLSIAFFTDPWGTYVELTEGLTQVQ
jgi:catechol 2,3-dioxygenase-like lactoylglutathione lyase family enzyme